MVFTGTDVYVYGPYDVELASAIFLCGKPCGDGAGTASLTVVIMVINQKFFISGFKGLLNKSPEHGYAGGSWIRASFLYSVYALFAMTDAQVKGDMAGVMAYMHEFYFESAAMILTLITVGKMLEAHSKGKTTDALKSLMKLAPKTAVLFAGRSGSDRFHRRSTGG